MIKVFTTNKDGKIELTAKELKELLDEAYWEGHRANNFTYVYNTPNWSPYCTTSATTINSTATGAVSSVTLSSNTSKSNME